MSKVRNIALLLVGLAILATLPIFLSPNLMNAVIKMMIAALFALAFTLAMGQAGMLSFGHAAYYGVGAFAALHLMRAVEMKLFFFPTPLIPLANTSARINGGDFTPNFLMRLMAKDLTYAQHEGALRGVPLETAASALEVFERAIADGYGDRDLSAVVESLRRS